MWTPLPTSSGSGFGEKGVRDHPGRPQRSNESLAKCALAAKGAEGIGVARTVGSTGIEELLLERGDQAEACHFIELPDSAAQKIARAAFPGATVGIADVAKKEMLDRRAIGKIDPHLGRGIGHNHEVSGSAERRVPDWPERRHHQVAACPPDTLLEAQRQLARGEPLAAREARDVAGRHKNQLFPNHFAASPIPLHILVMSARIA